MLMGCNERNRGGGGWVVVENQGDISLKPFNFSGGMIMESISKFVLENHRPLVFPFTRVTTARTDMRRDGHA